MKTLYDEMLASEDVIKTSIAETEQQDAGREHRDAIRTYVNYGLGIGGAIIGIIGVVIALTH